MAAIFAFKCRSCGDVHEGSPSFAFKAPDPYANLSAEDKASRATLDSDVCTIAYEDQTDRFIRAVLEVPIHGQEDPFLWGIWVSVSEKSLQRYLDTLDEPVPGDGFFGWLSNQIAIYPSADMRPANVFIQQEGDRPKVVIHTNGRENDPLVIDQQNGISVERAQELAELAMHGQAREE